MEFVVSQLWDGTGAEQAEIVRLRLEPRAAGLGLVVDAPFHGDPAPSAPPGVVDGLWEFEVVELFLLGARDHYLEVELGPHGHHLALDLEGRRQTRRRGLSIEFTARREGARWAGTALIPWSHLPEGPLRGNAYAIHGVGPDRRYLAWAPVPGDGPDFHRLEYFQPIALARP